MAIDEALLTAEEFYRLEDNGQPMELVRGRIIPMNVPAPRHGQICGKIVQILGNYSEEHNLGHVLSNDSGVITERDPDSVRGADVAFYSYARLPKGPIPEGYLSVVPELIFEVLSPDDRWAKVLAKVTEYLNAGVKVVGVLDPESQTLELYFADQPPRTLGVNDELILPELLGEFRVPVRRFLE
jgi:Uma2 family endonuclease